MRLARPILPCPPCSAVKAPPHPVVRTTMRSLSGGSPRYVFLLLALLPFRVGAAAPDANRICVPRYASPSKRVKSNIRREDLDRFASSTPDRTDGLKRNLAENPEPKSYIHRFASVKSYSTSRKVCLDTLYTLDMR